jgi:hypothetical protein
MLTKCVRWLSRMAAQRGGWSSICAFTVPRRVSGRLGLSVLELGAISFFLTILLYSPPLRAEDRARLCFISLAPRGNDTLRGPWEVAVLTLDFSRPTLDTLWSPLEQRPLEEIRVYPGTGSVLLIEGYPSFHAVTVLSMQALDIVGRFDLSQRGLVTSISQYQTGEPYGQLAITYREVAGDSTASSHLLRVSPSRVSDAGKAASESGAGEIRLAGSASAHTGEDADVIYLRNISVSPPVTNDSGFLREAFPVPDGIVRMKSSFGWNMFAHEPAFIGLCSLPDRSGLTQRELLLYERDEGVWRSVLLPGDGTRVRPLNGWIVGEVVHTDPRNDWSRRTGHRSTVSDSSLIIDPLNLKTLIVDLGRNSQILWMEQDTVYYRTGDSLCRARVGESFLIDRQPLLVDPRVQSIHWAFRGGETVKE